MADTQDLIVRLTMENGQFNAAVVKSGQAIKDTENKTTGLKGAISRLRLGYIAIAGVLSGVVAKAFSSIIQRASDAQETLQKFGVVFSRNIDGANKSVKELVKNYGLSTQAARTLLSDTGDLLAGFNFTDKQTLELSSSVQKLAADLASFSNFAGGAEGASQALTKALLGERESVKALGIAILEEDVKAKVAALEATGRFTNETERQRKAIATLEIAYEQSKNAIGDFQRSQSSFANQARILRGRIDDIVIAIGTRLLPVITPIVEKLNDFIGGGERLDQVADATYRIVNGFGAIFAIVKGLGLVIKNNLVDPFIVTTKLIVGTLKILNPFAAASKEQFKELGMAFQGAFDNTSATESFKEAINNVKNAITGLKESEIESSNESKDLTISNNNKIIESDNAVTDNKLNNDKKEIESEEQKTAKILEESQKRIGILSHFASQGNEIATSSSELVNNLIDLTTKNTEEAEKKKREARKATAVFEKVASIFSIGVNTARAIVGFLADPGGYAGVGLSVAAGIAGTLNAAAVATKPIPGFEKGGIISGLSGNAPGNEDGIIAAQNGEAILNRRATAVLGEDAINALNNGRGLSQNVVININGGDTNKIESTLNKYFKSYGGARQLQTG